MNLLYLECVKFVERYADGAKAMGLERSMTDRLKALTLEQLRQVADCGHVLVGPRIASASQLIALEADTLPCDHALPKVAREKIVAVNAEYLMCARDLLALRQGKALFALPAGIGNAISELTNEQIRKIALRAVVMPIMRVRKMRHLDALIEGGQNARAYSVLAGLSTSIIDQSSLVSTCTK